MQLGGIAAVLLIALWVVGFAFRSGNGDAEPHIRASYRHLQAGWYQLQIAIGNRAPYGVVVDALSRVRPRTARLMAPIKQVSTREGEFQAWTHPSTDKATTSIPLALALGSRQGSGAAISSSAEGQVTAWLFLPEDKSPEDVVLELALVDGDDHLRLYRFSLGAQSA